MREGKIDEGGEMILEKWYKGSIKYEDLGKSPGGEDIGVGGYVGGAGEEIRYLL